MKKLSDENLSEALEFLEALFYELADANKTAEAKLVDAVVTDLEGEMEYRRHREEVFGARWNPENEEYET